MRSSFPPAPRSGLVRALPALLSLVCASASGCASTEDNEGGLTQIEVEAVPAVGVEVLALLTEGTGSLLVLGRETDSLVVRYALSAQTRGGLFPNQVETIDKKDSLVVAIRPTQGVHVDLQVEMPEKLTVDLRDEGREVVFRNVENRVDVFLHEGGSLDFDDIEGPLTIHDGAGPIRIHDVRGPIDIRDKGGLIQIHEVKNSVRVAGADGDVSITSVGGDVELLLGAGRLTVRDVAGRLSYRKTGSGEVTIESVSGGVEKR